MLPLGRLSPYPLAAADIRERELELASLAGRLAAAMHPSSSASLRAALAGVHSYYSNLIEGPSTEPIAAEMAIAGRLVPQAGTKEEKYFVQARAGIEAAFLMQERLKDPKTNPVSAEFIRFLHREFSSRLPEELLWAEDPDGRKERVIPGEFRTGHVRVGVHIPPDPAEVPGLIEALSEFERVNGRTLASLMLMHHRLAWVHPFVDGNGRTARLFTEAMLLRSPAAGGGLWCLSRGLAKNAQSYKEKLAHADATRCGPHDGRGELSMAAAEDFVRFMLDTAIDQALFMSERLGLDHLVERIESLSRERAQVLGRDERAGRLLTEVILRGSIDRGRVGELVGLSARRGRDIARECLDDGLLYSQSEKGALLPRFPMYAMAYLFPNLFPLDNPRMAMREYLEAEVSHQPAGSRLRDGLTRGGAIK
jgi:Fic family protein